MYNAVTTRLLYGFNFFHGLLQFSHINNKNMPTCIFCVCYLPSTPTTLIFVRNPHKIKLTYSQVLQVPCLATSRVIQHMFVCFNLNHNTIMLTKIILIFINSNKYLIGTFSSSFISNACVGINIVFQPFIV